MKKIVKKIFEAVDNKDYYKKRRLIKLLRKRREEQK